jgi:micrococcal nuclease
MRIHPARFGLVGLGVLLAVLLWAEAVPAMTGSRGLAGEFPSGARLWGTVQSVLGAEQLVVVTQDQASLNVKLLGIEAPEESGLPRDKASAVPGQPYGRQAATYLHDLLAGKQVQLDDYGKDRRGRILAVVWLGDLNVNLILVKEGLAWVSPTLKSTSVRVQLEVAERQAQVGRYGLWALPNPEPPWTFRKRHRLADK